MIQKKSSTFMLVLLGILTLFGMAECSRGPVPGSIVVNEHNYDQATITLERSTCFGTCPSYFLKITGDGSVEYEGRQFVAIKGEAKGEISKSDFKMLVDMFFKIDYFKLKDKYDGDITDVPHCETSITIDGKSKKIFDRWEGPQDLIDLEKLIDKTVNSDQWIKGLPER